MDMEKINIELESIDKKADLIYEEIKECLKESNDKNAIIHKEKINLLIIPIFHLKI